MTNDHLDDEAISAYLDGEGPSTEAAHVEGCGACGARLEALRAAATAIGTPPPPPGDARRDAAVAAAVRAGSAPATVVPLRGRRPPQWLAAAAAVLVIVALIPVLSRFGGGSDDQDMTAAGGGDATEQQLESSADDAQAGATRLGAPAVTIDGGNVGEVSGSDVRRLVEQAVTAPPPSATAAREGQDERTLDDGDAAFGTGGGGGAAPVDGQGDTSAAPCEDRARSDFEEVSALRYRAIGTVDGVDVSILAFDLIADEPRLLVLALSLEDCTIKLSQDVAVEP